MDVERLRVLQVGGTRVRVGKIEGLIVGYRSGASGWIRLDVGGEEQTVPAGEVVELEPVDEAKVAALLEAEAERERQVLRERAAARAATS